MAHLQFASRTAPPVEAVPGPPPAAAMSRLDLVCATENEGECYAPVDYLKLVVSTVLVPLVMASAAWVIA